MSSPSTNPAEPVNPVLAALAAAEYDDEPLTAEDLKAIEEGRAVARRGELVPHEEVRKQWLAEK